MQAQEMTATETAVDPAKIMQVGMGFWASKTLLTAVNLDLFTFLASGPKRAAAIRSHLGLQERGFFDFMDTLVSLGFLEREGIKEAASYANAEDSNLFLDKNKPTFVGGLLIMANNRLYKFWDNLEEALKTGKPQNEGKISGRSLFEDLYADPNRLQEFLNGMAGAQMANFMAFAKGFDFSPYATLCDMGGGGGYLAAQVVLHNPHLRAITFDLPVVAPVAQENISRMNLSDRVTVQSGNFFESDFPRADIITMGNILHDWGQEDKQKLIQKAFQALPAGGVLAVIENVIDADRRRNTFGLLMSLNMLIETDAGFDYSPVEFDAWAKAAGFQRTALMPLTGPSSALLAYK